MKNSSTSKRCTKASVLTNSPKLNGNLWPCTPSGQLSYSLFLRVQPRPRSKTPKRESSLSFQILSACRRLRERWGLMMWKSGSIGILSNGRRVLLLWRKYLAPILVKEMKTETQINEEFKKVVEEFQSPNAKDIGGGTDRTATGREYSKSHVITAQAPV
jgi:hypothetical protein